MYKKKGFVAWILICAVLAFYIPNSALATDGDAENSISAVMKVTGTYGQTDARTMLELVNNFRHEEDVWYWNSDNTSKTILNDLKDLTYDYNLEQIAMQRAMEVALSFSHTRPDGSSCFTATYGGTSTWGENIAAGSATYEGAFNQWREEKENYAGQGHRRSMLSNRFTAIGIGHVVYQGTHYWVQEFGDVNSNAAETNADNAEKTVQIEVAGNQITGTPVLALDPTSYQIKGGEAVNLPKVNIQFKLNDTWPESRVNTAEVIADWTSASDIIEVSGGTITAVKDGKTQLKANILGQEVSVDVDVEATCAHQWDDGVVTKQATCTSAGVKTYTCGICGETREENIEKLPHDLQVISAVAATCTAAGSTEGKVCKVCDTVVEEVKTIPALGHDLGEWKVKTEATWDTEGIEERTCSRCDFFESRQIASLSSGHEHSFTGKETIIKEATCTENGEKQIACINSPDCTAVQTSTIPALGHKWNNGEVKTEATCTQAGEKVFTCTECGEINPETEVIPATGHKWNNGEVKTEATCTENGKKVFTCQTCQETKEEDIVATGHQWDNGTIEKEATCTENGEKVYVCVKCGEERPEKEVIAALGHSYNEPAFEWTQDYSSASAEFTCTRCGNKEVVSAVVTTKKSGKTTSYTAEVVFGGKTYNDSKDILSVDDTLRVIVDFNEINIPETLEKYSSKEEIVNAFTQIVEKNEGYSNKNMAVYDANLEVLNNGVWEAVTKDNFPKEGLTITIPYPEGTNGEKFDFVVHHMITYDINDHKAGDIENLAVTKTEDGLQVTVMSLSPFSVAWKEIVEKQETIIPDKTENTTSADKNPADSTTNPADTGDSSNIILWVVLGLSAACGCISIIYTRQRKYSK